MSRQIGGRTRSALALVMGLMLLLGTALTPALAAAPGSGHAKVVIIVGPVGRLTDDYRALADEAAAAARARSDNVVTVYSPNATWPVVRRALQGASIVVYVGHGNGWPSPYRDALYRVTQNGLGLNPVAGADNEAHQYFGERYLARDVKLATGAVVILGHLCYASGNAEPGMSIPSLEVARQRADNYAAGWMAAGATAVVAEGLGRPAYYVKALLKGVGTIERMWRAAPTYHDQVDESASSRSPGTAVLLDPDPVRGYYRSLAYVAGAQIADSLAGAPTGPLIATGGTGVPEAPSPADRGARFGAPEMDGRTVAGSEATLTLPIDPATLSILPDDASIGTRWDPLVPLTPREPEPDAPDPSLAATASPGPSAAPGTSAAAGPEPPATAAPPSTEATPAPDDPPTIDLIGPETLGTVVAVAPAVRTKGGLTIPVTLPHEVGLYRLVTTIHDGDGVAFDAATQALVPALLVQVTAAMSASYGVPDELRTSAGQPSTIRVRVANTGTVPWGALTTVRDNAEVSADRPVAYWQLGDTVGTFVDSVGGNDADAIGSPIREVANESVTVDGGGVAFPTAGDYLDVPDAKDLDLGDGPFSIEFWFRRETDTGTQVSLLNKGPNGYSIAVLDNDRLSLGKVGVANLVSEAGTTPADGTWHHFVVTRSGPGAGKTRWYKDGVEGHIDISPKTHLANTASDLEIGREGENGPGGVIDELAIYKSVLPAKRVAAHYAPRTVATSGDAGPEAQTSARRPSDSGRTPLLVARWISLDLVDLFAPAGPAAPISVTAADIDPGGEAVLDLELQSPVKPGNYLLILDLQTEDGVSLASIGTPPAIARVVVGPAPGQDLGRPAAGGG